MICSLPPLQIAPSAFPCLARPSGSDGGLRLSPTWDGQQESGLYRGVDLLEQESFPRALIKHSALQVASSAIYFPREISVRGRDGGGIRAELPTAGDLAGSAA